MVIFYLLIIRSRLVDTKGKLTLGAFHLVTQVDTNILLSLLFIKYQE